ncbi:MAG: FAD-dependent oxidoreductase [Planctomycetota bacterium]
MPPTPSPDVLVLGGGIVGLSIAHDLAGHGLRVRLLERDEPGRQASWAGAGILPPASWYVDDPTLDALAIAAAPMHAELSATLREETGLDDEYTPSGALYRLTETSEGHVRDTLCRWAALGVSIEERRDGRFVPGEAQVRNPRRLRAIIAACRARGVEVRSGEPPVGFRHAASGAIDAVRTPADEHSAGAVVFAAGCWNPALTGRAGSIQVGRPIRGEMLLFRPVEPPPREIVHQGSFYLVPRRDGRVLVGATVEDAGFDARTTDAGRRTLLAAAAELWPPLAQAPVEAAWAGLRPASGDALPLVGPLPRVPGAFVASGHHRSGLQLAPPTARLISAMVRGAEREVDALPFDARPLDPSRFVGHPDEGAAEKTASAVTRR